MDGPASGEKGSKDWPASGQKGSTGGATLSPLDDGLGNIDFCEEVLLEPDRDQWLAS
jgi:hypothetical protein